MISCLLTQIRIYANCLTSGLCGLFVKTRVSTLNDFINNYASILGVCVYDVRT